MKKSDIVLVHDNLPRNQWKLGVISLFSVYQLRSVYLRTANGHLRRPIEKLYPLGVTEKVINTIPENDKQEGAT